MTASLLSILHQIGRTLPRLWQPASAWVRSTFGPPLARWWGNPLLHTARLEKPLPWKPLRRVIYVGAGLMGLAAVLAWVTTERALGAAMIALPLGIVLVNLIGASVAGVRAMLAQLRSAGKSPRIMTTADPAEIVWGTTLVALWRLRWLIAAGLIVTPALVIGMLHLDSAAYATYRDSVLALGSAAPPEQVRLLNPGAGIPYFRLVVRAISAGLLPWIVLPLLASLSVAAALLLRDATLSQLVSLIVNLVALIGVGGVWQFVTTTYFLGQWLEIVRVMLIAGLFAGVGALVWAVGRLNAELLVNIPPEEGII